MSAEDTDPQQVFVQRFGYKPYDEEILGTFYRIRSLILFNIRNRMWNQRSTLIASGTFTIIALLILIPLALFAQLITTVGSLPFPGFLSPPEIHLTDVFTPVTALILLNPFAFIFLGVLGGRIIAEDIEYGTSDAYIIRIDRKHYFMGKFGALWISNFTVLLVPTLILYWFITTQFLFPPADLDNLATLVQALIFCFLAATFLTNLILTISAFTDKKNYASLMFIVGSFGIPQIIHVFVEILNINELYYFSVMDVLFSLWFGLVGTSDLFSSSSSAFSSPQFNVNLPVTDAISIVFIAFVVCIALSYNRVRKIS